VRNIQFGDFIFDDNGTVETVRDNFKNVVTRTRRLPGVSGGYDNYGSLPAPTAIGDVFLSFAITAQTEQDYIDRLDALNALAAQGKQTLSVTPGEGRAQRSCQARINNINDTRRSNSYPCWVNTTINFQVDDPRWLEAQAAQVEAVSGTSTTFTVDAGGMVFAIPKITVSCSAMQSVTSFRIDRLVDAAVADQINYSGAIGNSESLVIDVGAKSIKLEDDAVYSDMTAYDWARWFILEAGENTIRVVLNSGGAATVTIQWQPAYK